MRNGADEVSVTIRLPDDGGSLIISDDPDGVGDTGELTRIRFEASRGRDGEKLGSDTELPWLDRETVAALIQALVFRLRVSPGGVDLASVDPDTAALRALQDAMRPRDSEA